MQNKIEVSLPFSTSSKLPPNGTFLFSAPLSPLPGLLKFEVMLRMEGFRRANFPNKDFAIKLGLEASAGPPWPVEGASNDRADISSPKKVLPI